VDCDYAKERLCDFPNAKKGGLPMGAAVGAWHYVEEKDETLFILRIVKRADVPAQLMFQSARLLVEQAESTFQQYKSKLN